MVSQPKQWACPRHLPEPLDLRGPGSEHKGQEIFRQGTSRRGSASHKPHFTGSTGLRHGSVRSQQPWRKQGGHHDIKPPFTLWQ